MYSGLFIWAYPYSWTLSLTKSFKLILIIVVFLLIFFFWGPYFCASIALLNYLPLKIPYSQSDDQQSVMNCCCIWYRTCVLRWKMNSFLRLCVLGSTHSRFFQCSCNFQPFQMLFPFQTIFLIYSSYSLSFLINFRCLIGGCFSNQGRNRGEIFLLDQ